MNIEPFEQNQDCLLMIKENKFLYNNSVSAGFTTRKNGNGSAPYDTLNTAFHVEDDSAAVLKNRQLTANRIGFPLENWAAARQVHGASIWKAGSADRGRGAMDLESAGADADGIYTREKNVLLTSVYADCVPLLFHAAGHQCAGLAHAGWKGTAMNIAGAFVQTWKNIEQIDPEDIQVVIGPAISKPAYEVDSRVIEAMKQVLPSKSSPPWDEKDNGKFQLDMKEMNRLLLIDAGVPLQQIYVSRHCTYKESRLFFSHRRDGARTGRMMSWIALV
ncbi:peptidoglycan editing factor PgeF [Alteribacillus sp. HJP-4]|uniref:peptidoglycan editing factor PgeF n=1 Tax=Alteribacillus sp. HJP-4 TaxID=2775394 RepID=UPI0035CCE3FA